MEDLKVAIGSDHGGFEYKEKIIEYLKSRNIPYVDMGTHTKEACDYPEIARAVAERVIAEQVSVCQLQPIKSAEFVRHYVEILIQQGFQGRITMQTFSAWVNV